VIEVSFVLFGALRSRPMVAHGGACALQMGEVSAEIGAGIYFEERHALLASLWRLLQMQALAAVDVGPDLFRLITSYNRELLSAQANGRAVLVARLVELIKVEKPSSDGNLQMCFEFNFLYIRRAIDSKSTFVLCSLTFFSVPINTYISFSFQQDGSLEPAPGSRLPAVVNSQGNAVERHTLIAKERTLLCECLLYAVTIKQRLSAADIADLVDLLHTLALRWRGTGHGDLATLQQVSPSLLLQTKKRTQHPHEASQPTMSLNPN
jgi:hypothetical protein